VRSKAVVAEARGGPETLRLKSREVPDSGPGQVLVRIEASSVSLPDVQARYGRTPFPPRLPFVPGYTYVGEIVALGPDAGSARVGDRVGVLAIVGGYAEHALADARKLIPVPDGLDAGEAAIVILNYLVAYQVMHRSAKVAAGDPVLIVGASGGIGTALLQLGRLAGLHMYGLASASKHDIVSEFGGMPIDYRSADVEGVIGAAEKDGLAAVFDGVGGEYVARGLRLLRPGGTHVVYGNPQSKAGVLRLLWILVTSTLRRDGRRLRVYGTTSFLRNQRPFREDWATLFTLLEERRIAPVIAREFPLEQAAEANRLLEAGGVVGNLVLRVREPALRDARLDAARPGVEVGGAT
jgi:NADPH:quinone reductase-like Zn-dependent oxidoreductase